MPALSSLIEDAAPFGRISFGNAGQSVPISSMIETGQSWFGSGGEGAGVGALLTNDRPSVELVLGSIAAGTRLVSLPPPSRAVNLDSYVQYIQNTCSQFHIDSIVVRDDIAPIFDHSALHCISHQHLRRYELSGSPRGTFELVQFSSGSTGFPKSVRLTDSALGRNIGGILDAVQPSLGDVAVSWLPLSHDMGLVGMLLAAVAAAPYTRGELLLQDPEVFLRTPRLWIDALSERGGTFAATPDFGLRLATRHTPRSAHDLSRLRCLIVGGEIVRAPSLAAAIERFEPFGLRATALCPAYGMAEIGLAVTISRPSDPWVEERLDAAALALGRVKLGNGGASVRIAGSGTPLVGYDVRTDCEPGRIGNLLVQAPSIGSDALTGRSFESPNGYFRTGDLGYVRQSDGQTIVVGRSDDYIVANGRNIYAPTLQDALSESSGVRSGRVAVAGIPTGEWIVAIEPAELTPLSEQDQMQLRKSVRAITVEAVGAAPDDILVVRRGTLPYTSSGKLQRAKFVAGYLDQTLAAQRGKQGQESSES